MICYEFAMSIIYNLFYQVDFKIVVVLCSQETTMVRSEHWCNWNLFQRNSHYIKLSVLLLARDPIMMILGPNIAGRSVVEMHASDLTNV